MAKEPEQPEGEAPKKKGKLLIIIIAVAAVVLVGGGVGAYLLLKKPATEQNADAHGEDAAEEEVAQGDGHAPIYEKLEQFTTRLSDGETYLQCEINLRVADAKVQEKIKTYMPEIRDMLLRLLSSKTVEEMSSVEGRDLLAEEVQQNVNQILGVKKASKGVQKVLFPAFIIQ
ncbi:MAG: flagellar basal body-associated FliL family protein [Betaproteobacteria bacterium]|nr:flagellar basal body-associated FliL family protein [Betaproteobacteria bacterium]